MSDLFGNHIVGFPTRRLIFHKTAIFPGIVLEFQKNIFENEDLSLIFLKLKDFLEKISKK